MLQKVIFSCVRATFFVFKVTVSPAENNSRDTFLKTLSKNRGMPSIKVEIYQDMNVTQN